VTGGVVMAVGIGTTQPCHTIAAHVYDIEQETRLLMLIDTHTRLTHPVPMSHMPRRNVIFSPDGQRVLIPHGVGAETQLAVFSVQEGGLIYENPSQYVDCNPNLGLFNWSPNDEYVVFQCQSTALAGLHILDLARGETRQISPDDTSYVSWSPDSNAVLLKYENALVVYDVQSGEAQTLVEERTRIGLANWSPDGTQIAYIFNDSLRIVDIASGDQRIIPGGRMLTFKPQWSPDGRWIALVEQDLLRAMTVDLATDDIYLLDGGDLKINGVIELTWSPMGDTLAIIYADDAPQRLALSDRIGEQMWALSNGLVDNYAFSSDGHFLGYLESDSILSVYDLEHHEVVNRWHEVDLQSLRWVPATTDRYLTYIYRNFEDSTQSPLQLYWLDINSDAPQRLLDPRYSVINYTFWSRNND